MKHYVVIVENGTEPRLREATSWPNARDIAQMHWYKDCAAKDILLYLTVEDGEAEIASFGTCLPT